MAEDLVRRFIVWFDSMGAKSSSLSLGSIVIDPGAAIMHPSFPASMDDKLRWLGEALERVEEALRSSDVVVITHYHYDHYIPGNPELYRGKTLLVKNPNEYINESQRRRAYEFYSALYSEIAGLNLEEELEDPPTKEYPDPLEGLPEASSRNFGDYQERRMQLIERGRKWYRRVSERWRRWGWIPEIRTRELQVYFADGGSFNVGGIRLRFTEPLFHGIEYSRLGWVVGLILDTGRHRVFYSSDVNGPIIEDYASLIADENPDILVLDGPPTYMLGYMLNKVNLSRALGNAVNIMKEASRLELVVYDHHLARDPRFRERTRDVWEQAGRLGVELGTAAEFLGLRPVVLEGYRG